MLVQEPFAAEVRCFTSISMKNQHSLIITTDILSLLLKITLVLISLTSLRRNLALEEPSLM